MTMRPSLRTVTARLAIVLTVVGGACSASDASAPPPEPAVTSTAQATTTPQTTSTTTSTTVAETTTTDSTTTSVPASTTTAPTAPVTTNFDPTTIEGEVEAAILRDNEVFVECLAALPDCDVEEATSVTGGAFRESLVDSLTRRNAAGIAVREAETLTVVVEGVEVSDSRSQAIASICVVDATVRFRPGSSEEPEEIIDDSFVSFRLRYLLDKTNAGWLITASEQAASATGREGNLCL